MSRIIPIKDLKDTSRVSRMCHESAEPIFVTKNGYGDMVIMSAEAYEAYQERERKFRDFELERMEKEKSGR